MSTKNIVIEKYSNPISICHTQESSVNPMAGNLESDTRSVFCFYCAQVLYKKKQAMPRFLARKIVKFSDLLLNFSFYMPELLKIYKIITAYLFNAPEKKVFTFK